MESICRYMHSFRYNTTMRRKDRQTDGFAKSISRCEGIACWRAIIPLLLKPAVTFMSVCLQMSSGNSINKLSYCWRTARRICAICMLARCSILNSIVYTLSHWQLALYPRPPISWVRARVKCGTASSEIVKRKIVCWKSVWCRLTTYTSIQYRRNNITQLCPFWHFVC